jgi:hypothetical protein
MMALVFQNNSTKNPKTIKNVINLITMFKTTGFVDFILYHPELPKTHIFGFLESDTVNEFTLSVFGDIFGTLARSSPVKVLIIL